MDEIILVISFFAYICQNYTMIQIALTGSPFSDMDLAISKFRGIGVPVFNADLILNFILNHKLDDISVINNRLGYCPYSKGMFDPFKVKSNEDFDTILDVVEHDILEAYDRYMRGQRNSIYTIFASSLIYERKLQTRFDIVINCFTPDNERSLRAKLQNNILFSDFSAKVKSEMLNFDKNAKSDYVIHTYTGGLLLDESISSINEDIIFRINKLNSYASSRG